MIQNSLHNIYDTVKENLLYGRYICNVHIEPLLNSLSKEIQVLQLGQSELKKPIYGVKFGSGNKKILMWSQMHGNESTTTKAIFDLLNLFEGKERLVNKILKSCTLFIIPILNPDGAEVYTRENSNTIDLNRDAKDLSQSESKVLRTVFDDFQPDYCFNLHGQRTIFSAGKSKKPATLSFLAPAQNSELTITNNRKIAMEIIANINKSLQTIIPNQVGIYDDTYNENCVGDTFQGFGVPTVLFEAGHFPNDYHREETRKLIFLSLLISLEFISNNSITGKNYQPYLSIPENHKLFYDIIVRNADFGGKNSDVAIQYQERLHKDKIVFIPKVEKIGNLNNYFAHSDLNANNNKVLTHENLPIYVGYENDFVMINNEKITLKLH